MRFLDPQRLSHYSGLKRNQPVNTEHGKACLIRLLSGKGLAKKPVLSLASPLVYYSYAKPL